MIPLDGRGRLQTATRRTRPRPIAQIKSLLEPRSIAVLGASSKRANFGRIILNNIKECGYPIQQLYVVKDGIESLDGVRCVPGIADIPGNLDLLIMAATVKDMPQFVNQLIEEGKVASVILIPGGLGETKDTQDIPARIRAAISAARERQEKCPIFLGGNCLGMRSRPGKFDTFFIESRKLDPRRNAEPRRTALISQSGAFVITRMSNLQTLDPTLAISIGNQLDLTVSDMLRAVGQREDIDAIGVYIEGFQDLDGSAFVRAVEDVTAAGKVVVFYKAGRTEAGRSATAGHTASIAGDYDICQTGVANAGAIVTESFQEFEQLMELATALHDKDVGGVRVGAISNAGYETVGMADAIHGPSHEVELPEFSAKTQTALGGLLAKYRLDRLVNLRNPLDLTPMANDEAYEDCIRTILIDAGIDAVVAAAVPLTPEMRNMPDEIEEPGSTTARLSELFRKSKKPVVAVIDAGAPFETLALSLRSAGIPVFRSSDQAIRSLGRYLCHRVRMGLPRADQPEKTGEEQKRNSVIA
ncbi:MAG: CoA-binding protein [Planctomycetota bacterium]